MTSGSTEMTYNRLIERKGKLTQTASEISPIYAQTNVPVDQDALSPSARALAVHNENLVRDLCRPPQAPLSQLHCCWRNPKFSVHLFGRDASSPGRVVQILRFAARSRLASRLWHVANALSSASEKLLSVLHPRSCPPLPQKPVRPV